LIPCKKLPVNLYLYRSAKRKLNDDNLIMAENPRQKGIKIEKSIKKKKNLVVKKEAGSSLEPTERRTTRSSRGKGEPLTVKKEEKAPVKIKSEKTESDILEADQILGYRAPCVSLFIGRGMRIKTILGSHWRILLSVMSF
jgi:hypothetical protein